MTLTPERIAEFARKWDHDPEALEIARLARLGLRVQKVMEDLQAPGTVLALTRAAQAQASELEGDPATELRKGAKAAQAKIDRMLELAAGMDDPAPVLRKVEQLERERAGIAARIAHAEAAYVERSYLSKITEHHVRALLVDFAREIQDADRPHLK